MATPTVTPTEDQRLAAERGADLLDERMPGWAEKIDPATLDIKSGYACILAQLKTGGSELLADDKHMGDFGFFDPDWYWDGGDVIAQAAQVAWLEQIAERVSA